MIRYLFQTNYITNHDLITKLNNKNIFQLPIITKVILNIGLKVNEKKNILNINILLKLISNQKGFSTKSKKNKIFLRIKKGSIVGCKISLRKKNMFLFLEKLICFSFPKNKNIKPVTINNYNLSFKIFNIIELYELTGEFLKFKNIPYIDVTFCFKQKNIKKNQILLSSYNYPSL